MRNLYYVRTIRGIPVRLHYTWIVAALLGIPMLAEIVLPASDPELSMLVRILLSVVIASLFFLAVVLHECGHLIVARLFHDRVSTLNIYPLGAITRTLGRQPTGRAAFWIAAAGPAASIALWWALTALASTITRPEIALALEVTGTLSLYLGLINLLPGLPLDGGRMGHMLIRTVYGSFEDATRIMRICGQIIAYGLIVLGISAMLGEQNWPRALALIAVGWAIREAGGSARRRALLANVLHKLTAADILIRPRQSIGPERTLRAFASSLRGRTGNEPTPVIANDVFLGMIDRTLLRDVPQGYWGTRTVAETMLPAQSLETVAPTVPVSMLIPRLIQSARSAQPLPLPVVHEGRLLGLVDADEIFAILELEDEFGLFGRPMAVDTARAPLVAGSAQPVQQAPNRLAS
jgi:Zn-dependent protease